jgi:hypothetical protein
MPSVLFSVLVQNVLICLDPLLILPAERAVPRWLSIGLRTLWVLSFAVALLFAWNITPGSYLFYLHEALPFSPPSVLVSLAMGVSVLFWLLFYRDTSPKSIGMARTMVLAGLVLLVLKSLAGAGLEELQWIKQHVRSPIAALGRTLNHAKRDLSAPEKAVPQVTFNAFIRDQLALPPKIVVMLVESWGERADSLKQMGTDMQSERLRVLKSGLTTYRGSTLSGEFRELCSRYLVPTDELKDKGSGLDCAPAFLERQGYKTWGLHGYQRAFYARSTFWDRFGIDNEMFTEDLPGLERCLGAFEGTCDTALIKRGIDVLGSEAGRSFVYLLTLSSHEPLPPSALMKPAAFFDEVDVVHPTQVVTRRAISDLVVALNSRQDLPCTLVYIAGDHQPPSASAAGGIFESDKVPFLSFAYNCPPNIKGNPAGLAAR